MRSPEAISKVLGKSGSLKRLAEQCHTLQALERLLLQQLPPELAQHTRVASHHEHTLVLHADSPVWASQLRFHSRSLLEGLRQHPGLQTLSQIRVRTVPAFRQPGDSSARSPAG